MVLATLTVVSQSKRLTVGWKRNNTSEMSLPDFSRSWHPWSIEKSAKWWQRTVLIFLKPSWKRWLTKNQPNTIFSNRKQPKQYKYCVVKYKENYVIYVASVHKTHRNCLRSLLFFRTLCKSVLPLVCRPLLSNHTSRLRCLVATLRHFPWRMMDKQIHEPLASLTVVVEGRDS